MQLPRRPPQSLSLRSLGDLAAHMSKSRSSPRFLSCASKAGGQPTICTLPRPNSRTRSAVPASVPMKSSSMPVHSLRSTMKLWQPRCTVLFTNAFTFDALRWQPSPVGFIHASPSDSQNEIGSSFMLATAYPEMPAFTTRTSPNHALQRTAPGVTACAPTRRPTPATFPHRLRRPPQSLSLGSLGDSARFSPGTTATQQNT